MQLLILELLLFLQLLYAVVNEHIEDLLDLFVLVLLRRDFIEKQAVLLSEVVPFVGRYLLGFNQVAFVPNQHDLRLFDALLGDILDPGIQSLKGRFIGHVIDQQYSVCLREIGLRDGSVLLRPSSVPDLELDVRIVYYAVQTGEVHSYRGHLILLVLVLRESREDARLPHA